MQAEFSLLESKIQITKKRKYKAWSQRPINPIKDDYDFVTASKLIATVNEETDQIKRPKFSVKKESDISRKLAIIRGDHRCS